MESLICNFYLSVAAHKIEQVRPWDTLAYCWDVKQPANNYFTLSGLLVSEVWIVLDGSVVLKMFRKAPLLVCPKDPEWPGINVLIWYIAFFENDLYWIFLFVCLSVCFYFVSQMMHIHFIKSVQEKRSSKWQRLKTLSVLACELGLMRDVKKGSYRFLCIIILLK